MKSQAGERYSPVIIALHWLMALLIVAIYATIELADPGRPATMQRWHFMLGLLVLIFLAARFAERLALPTPPILPALPALQLKLAWLAHFLLYGFMLVMPILGWLILSARGQPVPFFGVALPPLIGKDPALAARLTSIHEGVAQFGYYLIAFHTVGTLVHHYVVKDNTVRRMLPDMKAGS